ncbi:MAG: ABC transporter ATP-binding protein [Spirochaetaceae bacterium]|nr:MAG: ABC transporter ATP-binding protein [Spirochaetaceae bacterium]
MTNCAIHVSGLGRDYRVKEGKKQQNKILTALADINLTINKGELFGILGPNGAGKTTLIKILTTLLAPTRGNAFVAGFDVVKDAKKIRPLINMVSGGEYSGYGLLTVRENLWMFSQFYGIPGKEAKKRIDELISVMRLEDKATSHVSNLSTGLRQKMNIIRGFLTDPEIIFLDEPTLGLDVQAAIEIRKFLRSWMREKPERTVLLTTHYMTEADELCNRLAIINHGKLIACDTPDALKKSLQQDIFIHFRTTPVSAEVVESFRIIPGMSSLAVTHEVNHSNLECVIRQEEVMKEIIGLMTDRSIGIIEMNKRSASLEDVFIQLSGKSMEEAEKE